MKIVVYVAVAVVLGIVVMLAPLMVFTVYGYKSVITQTEIGQNFLGRKDENYTSSLSEGGYGNKLVESPTFGEAAQLYGMLDSKTESFPASLFPVILLVSIGFITALGTTLFFRKKG